MKVMKKVILSLVICLSLAAALFGCNSDNVVGKYVYEKFEISGIDQTDPNQKIVYDYLVDFIDGIFKDMTIEFKADKTGVIQFAGELPSVSTRQVDDTQDDSQSTTQTFTYKISKGVITITSADNSDMMEDFGTVKYTGGKVVIEVSDDTMVEGQTVTFKITFKKA